MAVHFTNNLLLVGYRARDWTPVWYGPVADMDDNDERGATIGLYSLTTGPVGHREPMEGEVLWFPPFDPKNCESKSPAERKRMQQQFLTDAHRYLTQRDAEAVRAMEEDLDDPKFRRWQMWFEHAKKWKRGKMRERDRRRQRRERGARDAGVTEEDIRQQMNSDTSEDSAYESVSGRRQRESTANWLSHMPPPPRPRKGKRADNDSYGRKATSKKRKRDEVPNRSNDRQPSPFMSGSLGNLSNHYDALSEQDFDIRDPNIEASPAPDPRASWGFENIMLQIGQGSEDVNMGRASPRNDAPGNHPDGASKQNFQPTDENDNEVETDGRAELHEREQSILFQTEEDALKEAIQQSLDQQGTQGRSNESVAKDEGMGDDN